MSPAELYQGGVEIKEVTSENDSHQDTKYGVSVEIIGKPGGFILHSQDKDTAFPAGKSIVLDSGIVAIARQGTVRRNGYVYPDLTPLEI